ncbi:tetratricopeptide repeat protein [Micromonospora sp. MA102]|uniref:tetratricopeptide repeat protein n=1 Tax=Micromonospora sp. MA102 TaxID=2952755 RepID=UPI0021CA9361|nr:tetratricopeptide repeat protein [Micromonospora sp. MA102]
MSTTGALALARVMAHCGGSPAAATSFIARAITADPRDPEPYSALENLRRELPAEVAAVVAAANTIGPMLARAYLSFVDGDMDEAAMSLGAVTGYQPDVPWASAPWFCDERFLGAVTPAALAEATMRIHDYDRDLDTDAVRECLAPWFRAIEAVCNRDPDPDAMARMAILLRACGRTDASFALCDQADAVRRVTFTEVVRAGTWRHVGNLAETAAAFRRALALDPANWSLHLDLADVAAEEGDFAEAAALAARGEELEPDDVTMRAAAAAYRARSTGSVADLNTLAELAPQVPEPYRRTLIDYARGT